MLQTMLIISPVYCDSRPRTRYAYNEPQSEEEAAFIFIREADV